MKNFLIFISLVGVLMAQNSGTSSTKTPPKASSQMGTQKIDTAAILREYQMKSMVDTTSLEYLQQKQILRLTQQMYDSNGVKRDTVKNEYNELDSLKNYRVRMVDPRRDPNDSTKLLPLENFGHTILRNLGASITPSSSSSQDSTTQLKQEKKPIEAMPVNSGYRLGPNDEMVINMWGDVHQNMPVTIDRSGAVNIPGVGQVIVAGLTLQETKSLLIKKFSQVYSGVKNGRANATTFVDVSLGKARSKMVIVSGYVQNPGSYPIPGTGGIIAALAAAGGPSDMGSIREIVIQHQGMKPDTVDLYSFLLSGNLKDKAHISDYDVIVVPAVKRRAAITGAVVQPAYYDLKKGEGLQDLLNYAGGLLSSAYTQNIMVNRFEPNKGREQITLPSITTSNTPLVHGDSLDIPFMYEENSALSIEGAVMNPGKIGYKEGMMLYDAILLAGGVSKDYFPDRFEILRTHDDLKYEVLSVNGGKLIASLGGEENIPLQKRDVIKIYSIWDLQSQEYVIIRGEVKQPGKYALRKGMNVQDLILLAGGLLEQANRDSVEVSRISTSDSYNGNTTEYKRMPFAVDFFTLSNFALQNRDHVFVRSNSARKDQEVVYLKGEFSYPGPYAKLHENESLLSLIQRAGGIKKTGYLEGAIFMRGKDSIGVVSIDLAKLVRSESKREDIILEDGDTLTIPTAPKTVLVSGNVNYPTAVKFEKGKRVGYYIKRAGGYRNDADTKGVYSILANGAVKNVRKNSRYVNAGTQIFVPELPEQTKDPQKAIAISSAIVAMLASLSLIAVSINNISQ